LNKKEKVTMVFGLLGNPVGHSLSPLMHNAAYREIQLDAVYVSFCVNDLEGAIRGIRALDIKGVSVTIPFKTAVLPLLDEVDECARAIGAVNTIVNDCGRLTGFNTDWIGLVRSLEESTDLKGKTFAVIGAGGTARAAVFGIRERGGVPVVVNRSEERGRRLAFEFGCRFFRLDEIEKVEADCLINTTPAGMAPQEETMPVDGRNIARFRWVFDVIYRPWRTRFLEEAEKAGAETMNGARMLVYQGAEQIRLWTGQKPPVALMHRVVRKQLEAEKSGGL
jgi:shikimate dehydrogenase